MNLPPQAYTRETLMLAFDWIRSQPKQIQELASTSDALVSIYMQARRRGGQFIPTNPVSAQSFKQDLKNLAEGLKQFDGADGMGVQAPPVAPHPSQTYQAPQTQQPSPQFYGAQQLPPVPTQMPQAQPQMPTQQYVPQQQAPQQQVALPPQPTMPLPPAQPTYYAGATPATFESDMALDAKSISAVRQVQQRFNLSSENEAIRLLIALGSEKFREMAGK
jgi:hypothetical protein